jgi:DNA repair and recombination RAD54-like protein
MRSVGKGRSAAGLKIKLKMKRTISEVDSIDSSAEDLSQKVQSIDLNEDDDSDYKDTADQENSPKGHGRAPTLGHSTNKVLGMNRRFIPFKVTKAQEFKPLPRVGLNSCVAKAPPKPFSVPKFTNGRSQLQGGVRCGNSLGMRRSIVQRKGPLHDPEEEGAIVLYVPKIVLSIAQQFTASFKKDSKEPEGEVHVVIDPILGRVLRPHQIEVVYYNEE